MDLLSQLQSFNLNTSRDWNNSGHTGISRRVILKRMSNEFVVKFLDLIQLLHDRVMFHKSKEFVEQLNAHCLKRHFTTFTVDNVLKD
jgi:hypothetical protein